jgi:peroxiredoxin
MTNRALASLSLIMVFALLFVGANSAFGQDGTAESDAAKPPEVGAEAKDFELPGLDGEPVKLSELAKQGPVVVVVLRGWPGYQCPICSKQMATFVAKADVFTKRKARVVFIYPGPEAELEKRAEEFLRGEKLAEPFVMAIDPGYRFTNIYGLRWDQPRETAFPSTFVLDADRKVKFRKISHSHGDRAELSDVLKALDGKGPSAD